MCPVTAFIGPRSLAPHANKHNNVYLKMAGLLSCFCLAMGGVNAINYNLVNWKKEKMEKAADERDQSGQFKTNKFGNVLHTARDEKR